MFIKRVLFRIYQKIMYLLSFFISFKEPEVVFEANAIFRISGILQRKEINEVFIVTDEFLATTKSFKALLNNLKERGINYYIYDKTKPNPSIKLIEDAYYEYKKQGLEAIIAYGGGSVIDLAKVVGAKVARPKKAITKFKGTLKILKKIPLLIAVPTTIGTGSEATLAAVVSNKETQEKFAIMDPVLMPKYAILDVEIVKTLPKKLIAETGMDALTHAIEAYIGKANTRKTKKAAIEAIELTMNNLTKAYDYDLEALKNMQIAAYKAGVAFTRAYVGNVHAIAHTISGYYDKGHGYTNAVILPFVLEYYGKSIEKKLGQLADVLELSSVDDNHVKSRLFVDEILKLRAKLNIDNDFNGLIKSSDIEGMVNNAYHEANPLYPVPKIFNKNDFRKLFNKINGK